MESKRRWMLTALSVMLVIVFGGTAVLAQVNLFGLDMNEDDVISRGEFVLMIYNALGQPESTTECPVKGLSKEESQALSALMDLGAYKGLEPLPEQGYDSMEPIPRDEMLGVLANVFQLLEKSPEAQNALKNGATPGEWALYAVQNGLNQKKDELTFVLNQRTQDDVLDPASLTNEQAAELIEELLPKASEPPALSGPSVKITHKTSTVSVGQKASFTVKATSNGTLSYQWYKNGEKLSSEKKKTLTISAAQLADSGRYYCKVTAKLDGNSSTKNSGKATLTVLPLPDATISAPGKVTFNTDFYASVPDQAGVTYEWSVEDGTITGGSGTNQISVSVGGSASTITLHCTVTNGAGASATDARTVHAYPAPNATINAPGKVTFNTDFHASVPDQAGVTYEWSVDGGTIASGSGTNQISVSAGDSASTLTLHCTVTNGAGASATDARTVNAYPAPNATISSPGKVTFNTDFHASVPDQAGVTYEWSVEDGTITGGSGTNQISVSVGGSASTLTLHCTVTNGAGTSATDARTVHAYPAPNAEVSAPNSANVGDSIQVSVPSQSGCEYNWTINMESYTLNDHGNGTIEITPYETGHLIVGCTVVNPAGAAASGTSTTIIS